MATHYSYSIGNICTTWLIFTGLVTNVYVFLTSPAGRSMQCLLLIWAETQEELKDWY